MAVTCLACPDWSRERWCRWWLDRKVSSPPGDSFHYTVRATDIVHIVVYSKPEYNAACSFFFPLYNRVSLPRVHESLSFAPLSYLSL